MLKLNFQDVSLQTSVFTPASCKAEENYCHAGEFCWAQDVFCNSECDSVKKIYTCLRVKWRIITLVGVFKKQYFFMGPENEIAVFGIHPYRNLIHVYQC